MANLNGSQSHQGAIDRKTTVRGGRPIGDSLTIEQNRSFAGSLADPAAELQEIGSVGIFADSAGQYRDRLGRKVLREYIVSLGAANTDADAVEFRVEQICPVARAGQPGLHGLLGELLGFVTFAAEEVFGRSQTGNSGDLQTVPESIGGVGGVAVSKKFPIPHLLGVRCGGILQVQIDFQRRQAFLLTNLVAQFHDSGFYAGKGGGAAQDGAESNGSRAASDSRWFFITC